jgi:hypothetical protein
MIAALWRGTSQRYPSTTAAACAAAIEARRAVRAERCAIAGADVRIRPISVERSEGEERSGASLSRYLRPRHA